MKMRYGLRTAVFCVAVVGFGCRAGRAAGNAALSNAMSPEIQGQDAGNSGLAEVDSRANQDDSCAATFSLCGPFVANVAEPEWEPDANLYQIEIHLTEPGRRSFATFTGDWVKGRPICVTLGPEIIVRARVQARIDSGHMSAIRKTEAEGRRLVSLLRMAPTAPCGS